jgi:hypothetical protein
MRSITKEQYLTEKRAEADQSYHAALVAACAFWIVDYEHKLNHTDKADPSDPTKAVPGTGYFTDPNQPIKQAHYSGLLALLPPGFDLEADAADAVAKDRANAHDALAESIRYAIAQAPVEQMVEALAPLKPFMPRLDLYRTEVHSRAVRYWTQDQTVSGKVRKAAVNKLGLGEAPDADAALTVDVAALELKRKGLVALYLGDESTAEDKAAALAELDKLADELDEKLAPLHKHVLRFRLEGDPCAVSHADAPRHAGRIDKLQLAEVTDAGFVCSECGARPAKLIEIDGKLVCGECVQRLL